MSIFEAIVLGIVQGLTEFIPVSSSGHLVIVQSLMSGGASHLFLEFINIGTTIALFIYFRKKIVEIIRNIVAHKDFRLVRNIAITVLPASVVGFLAADFINSSAFFSSITTVMVALLLVGIIMIVLEKIPKASPVSSGEKLSGKRALSIGLIQVMALIPGVSRSGSTIIAGRLNGLKPAAAAEYSFLASLPIMIGVTLKVFIKDTDYLMANLEPLIIGNIAALLAGLLAVGFLMKFLAKHDLSAFGWYRVILAAVLLAITLL